MSLRKPQFVTHNSESSLVHESVIRKRIASPSPSERHDKVTSRFVDKSPLLPTKTTKVAVFNSSGEKTDIYDSRDLLSTSLINTDNESLCTSPSDYLIGRGYDFVNRAQTNTEISDKSPRRDHGQQIDMRPTSKFQSKRSRTKTLMSYKKRSKADHGRDVILAVEKPNLNSNRLNANGSHNSSRDSSRTDSLVDLNKNSLNASKRPTSDAIHQKIMKLKREATKNLHPVSQLSALDKAMQLSKARYLYQKIQKVANRNGSLRVALSMLVFGILLFCLISSIFQFDFILGIFRSIGRYLSSFYLFIAGRKKETSKSEVAMKYVGICLRFMRTLLVGTPNPGRY